MTLAEFICPQCKKVSKKYIGHLNRAAKIGAPVYCSKSCSGLARRKTVEEKKATKAAYDKKISKDPKRIAQKKAYDQTTKGREAQKRRRQTRMPKHVEYCRQPAYKAKKHAYDQVHQWEKAYGEYAEAAKLLRELEIAIDRYAAKN